MFKYFEWLLVLFPLSGALLNSCCGRRFSRHTQDWILRASTAALLLIALPLLVGEIVAPGLVGRPTSVHWIRIWTGSQFLEGPFALRIDALSLTAALTIVVGSTLVHVHTARRLPEGPARHLALALSSGGLAFLLVAVLADNMLFLLFGWSLSSWCAHGLRQILSPAQDHRFRDGSLGLFAPLRALASDLSLLLAIGVMSAAFASVSLDQVIAMSPAETANGPLPQGAGAVAILLLSAATVRAGLFPFHIQTSAPGQGTVPAGAYGLTAILPGVYLLARTAPLIEPSVHVGLFLAAWAAVSSLLLAIPALLQARVSCTAYYSALSPVGLVFLALGIGAYSTALSFLPALSFSQILLELALEDIPPEGAKPTSSTTTSHPRSRAAYWTRWLPICGLAALPSIVFCAQMLAHVAGRAPLLSLIAMLATVLLAASAFRLWHAVRAGNVPAKRSVSPIVPLTALLLGSIGVVNLLSPPVLGAFLQPVLGPVPDQPAWWWFGIVLVAIGIGVTLGRLGMGTAGPHAGIVGWMARGYQVERAYGSIARRVLQLGQFLTRTAEPVVYRWTLDALSRLLARTRTADDSQDQPIALSILLFLLGTAMIVAYLLLR
jgi:NADH-quinone oxidoreductase subunit L